MTLDEAIKHAEELAKFVKFEAVMKGCIYAHMGRDQDGWVETCRNPKNIPSGCSWGACDIEHCPDYKEIVERSKTHAQLAKWLKELKERREKDRDMISRKDAIDAICEYYLECERAERLSFTPNLIKQEVVDILCSLEKKGVIK